MDSGRETRIVNPFITPVLAQNTTKKAVKSVERILNEGDKDQGKDGKKNGQKGSKKK